MTTATKPTAPAAVEIPVSPKVLSFADIVALNAKVETKDVLVPELGPGVVVRLRVLSAGEAISLQEEMKGAAGKNAMVKLVQATALNADGTPMFPSPEHIEIVRKMNLKAVLRLQDEALELNDLVPEQRRKRLEQERKNGSSAAEPDDSLSD